MPVKFECPKCEKRFVDWGAERLDYKCPECDGEELVRVGSLADDKPARKPTLKRKPKAKPVKVIEAEDLDVVDPELVVDAEVSSDDTVAAASSTLEDSEIAVEDADLDAAEEEEEEEDDEIPQDLNFEDANSELGEKL
jgi:hypothetical protein